MTFNIRFTDDERFHLNFESQVIIVEPPEYLGPYNVTPKAWEGQRLETKEKLMRDDVTVEEVPYAEVSTPEGTTCIIATE